MTNKQKGKGVFRRWRDALVLFLLLPLSCI